MGDNDSTIIKTDTKAEEDVSVAIIDEEVLRGKIHVVRGQKVMLDFELAEIYGYTTKNFNRQVKNNIAKFEGEDFMIRLTRDELDNLVRCNNCTSREETMFAGQGGGTRYLPYVFTEQGVYMLMTVLRGELAVRQSRALIRLFKRLKDYALEGQELVGRGEFHELSSRVADNTERIDALDHKVGSIINGLSDAVRNSMISDVAESFGANYGCLISGGEPVEGRLAYEEVYAQAQESILVVDNYIGLGTLLPLKAARPGVAVTIATDNVGHGLHASELVAFRAEYPGVDVSFVRTCGKVHDRYIALDFGTRNERAFLCGASSKDAGTRASTILEAEHPDILHELFRELLANPPLGLG